MQGIRKTGSDTDIVLFPTGESSLLKWSAFIVGPSDSPYDTGLVLVIRVSLLELNPLLLQGFLS